MKESFVILRLTIPYGAVMTKERTPEEREELQSAYDDIFSGVDWKERAPGIFTAQPPPMKDD